MPDRNSADFRLAALMGMLADRHQTFFCPVAQPRQREAIGHEHATRYRRLLEERGVRIEDAGIAKALRAREYDVVMFEWYFVAKDRLCDARRRQPQARIVVDSVDIVYNRLEAKARVTNVPEDVGKARSTKTVELAVYQKADVVITVTDADAALLRCELPQLATFTIPNIHPLQDPVLISDRARGLLFIGSFAQPGGETNLDAMFYFCREILPHVAAAVPDVKLRIVGSSPTPEIVALASPHVEVIGFVPDIKPYLTTSAISVAPLRFGGGMKGKIGEAMSFALPVVTTSVGIEGFGLTPGRDALVADNPADFARALIHLLRDRAARDQVRMAGYRFISEHYSDVAARNRVEALFSQLHRYRIKRDSPFRLWRGRAKDMWDRHIGWRLK